MPKKKAKVKKARPRSKKPMWTVGIRSANGASTLAVQVRASNATRAARVALRKVHRTHHRPRPYYQQKLGDWHVQYICIQPNWGNRLHELTPILVDESEGDLWRPEMHLDDGV
jgi:hypothetical protein